MTNRNLILLNLSVLVIAVLVYFIVTGWSDFDIGTKFIVVVALGGVVGVLFVTFILPEIGDRIGAFFYTPPEMIQPDERQKAMAKIAQGDYEGAIDLFKKVAKNEPEDRFPIVEIAKIQVEQFNNPDAAIETLVTALAREGWRDNDSAFFHFRVAEIYLEDKKEPEKAREIYQEVIEKFPETRHSANATHKLHELGVS